MARRKKQGLEGVSRPVRVTCRAKRNKAYVANLSGAGTEGICICCGAEFPVKGSIKHPVERE